MEEFRAQDENETNYDNKTETLFEDKPHYWRIRLVGAKENHINRGAG